MNSTSPAQTGTAAAVMTCLVAVINALNNRLNLGLTPQAQVSVAGGIVVASHWLAQQYGARVTKKAVTPAAP